MLTTKSFCFSRNEFASVQFTADLSLRKEYTSDSSIVPQPTARESWTLIKLLTIFSSAISPEHLILAIPNYSLIK